jgi:hypothetical protein
MLTPINERKERALERWEKLRKSLPRAISSVRPIKKGRFTVYTTSPRRRGPIKPGKYGRFEVSNNSPKRLPKLPQIPKLSFPVKNTRYYLQRERNRIQKAVYAVQNAKRNKYQKELSSLTARHKIEVNNLKKKHEQIENNLYNKHFTNSNKNVQQLIRALNNINNKIIKLGH